MVSAGVAVEGAWCGRVLADVVGGESWTRKRFRRERAVVEDVGCIASRGCAGRRHPLHVLRCHAHWWSMLMTSHIRMGRSESVWCVH